MGRDDGGQSVRRAVKARKSPSSAKTDSEKSHSWFVEECLKTRAVEDKRTDNIRRSRRRILSFYSFMCLCALCMHSVCTLYASLSAYIFVPSALLLSQTVFLYALYAVNSGVVFSHSVHSRFFDAYNAYNAYKSYGMAVCCDPKGRATRLDGVRECLKTRTVEDDRL